MKEELYGFEHEVGFHRNKKKDKIRVSHLDKL